MRALRVGRAEIVIALCAVGTVIAAYLTFVALNGRTEAFCSGVGDCNAVQQSEYARVAGVPIALLGLAMYVALLGLALARRVHLTTVRPQLAQFTRTAIFTVALAGALYSAYLTYLELFVIEAICEWCVASALVVTAIAALAWRDLHPGRGVRET